ncbi:unnamed protein product [Rotaria socialis]|uniref:ADP ribosyltransferase domain-containing protein n=1 Tax=Rotaria socialis TaxID=392032 RepID=A0A818AP16_9BILA|nr:unnamed protein product [Rotaria socialis]CAF4315434.1 unnamed protein product [Rotaria socialis]
MGNEKSKIKNSSKDVDTSIETYSTVPSVAATTSNSTATTRSYFHRENHFETYTYVWLDQNVNERDNTIKTQKKLRKLINKLKIFSNFKECEEYVQADGEHEKLIIVVSGSRSYGRELVVRLQNVLQVRAIYMYCTNEEANEQWSQSFNKVTRVFSNLDELLCQIKQDQWARERTDEDSLAINFYSPNSSNHRNYQEKRDSQNASFMYFLIFIDILLKMPTNKEKAKKELLEVWSAECHGNHREERIIKQFYRTYKSKKAIYWYTRESFLYRILNKGLREADLDILFGLRFFLVDLHNQLKEEHDKYLRLFVSSDPILQVYRGQAIAVEELNLIRENQGQLISFNNFLSTSTNHNIAISFAKSAPLAEGLTRILFKFHIDTRLQGVKPYADISKLSAVSTEAEILVMIGSIFRIEDVNCDLSEQIWIAKLSMCSEDDYELKKLMIQMNTETEAGITSLGWLFYKQGDYEKGKEFFQQLLLEESLSDFDRANCCRGLGLIACQLKQYDEALIYYSNELSLTVKLGQQTETGIAYAEIGSVYARKREFNLALDYEAKALDILRSLKHPKLSSVYRVIADVFDEIHRFDLAIEYYEKALSIDRHHLEENHTVFGSTYLLMGITYAHMENHSKALEYFMKVHSIYSKSLPPNHREIIFLEQNIQQAKIDLQNQKLNQACLTNDDPLCQRF